MAGLGAEQRRLQHAALHPATGAGGGNASVVWACVLLGYLECSRPPVVVRLFAGVGLVGSGARAPGAEAPGPDAGLAASATRGSRRGAGSPGRVSCLFRPPLPRKARPPSRPFLGVALPLRLELTSCR